MYESLYILFYFLFLIFNLLGWITALSFRVTNSVLEVTMEALHCNQRLTLCYVRDMQYHAGFRYRRQLELDREKTFIALF